MKLSAISSLSAKSDVKSQRHAQNPQNFNTNYQQITNLPKFSNNQYLVNFNGFLDNFPMKPHSWGAKDLSKADIKLVKEELDELFSKTKKLATKEDKEEFRTFIEESERDDISALAFSYLTKEPELFKEIITDEHPLEQWGSGATKALLEYIENRPKFKKAIYIEYPNLVTFHTPLSGNGARGVWDYFEDKKDKFKEFILTSKGSYGTSHFHDHNDVVAIRILDTFKDDDEMIRTLLFTTNAWGRYVFTDETNGAALDILQWVEKEKPELYKKICHTADKNGGTVLDLLSVTKDCTSWETYPFIEYFQDKKDTVDKLFLREVKRKDGTKVIAGLNLKGNALDFALNCVKDKMRVYKFLKDSGELSMLNSLDSRRVIKFFDDILSQQAENRE